MRASGRIRHPDEIGAIVVAERQGGTRCTCATSPAVGVGRELRTGSATENGEEVVVGTALMLIGANSRTRRARRRPTRLARGQPHAAAGRARARRARPRRRWSTPPSAPWPPTSPKGAILVIVVLFLMLGNLRAALITALAIPLSMLLTAIGMVQTRTSGNLMSLGAIDFGLIVDGAVIIVENCLRLLAERQRALGRALTRAERLAVVDEASMQVRSATAFGEAIIIMVYMPILFLTGIEGKMFQPMALTVIFALVAAFVLSLTFVPAMVALAITGRVRERASRIVAAAARRLRADAALALRWRVAVVARRGRRLRRGAAAVRPPRPGVRAHPERARHRRARASACPSTGAAAGRPHMQRDLERAIARLPEVAFVFSRTGTQEMATDPMPPYISDTFVMLQAARRVARPARHQGGRPRAHRGGGRARSRQRLRVHRSRSRCASTSCSPACAADVAVKVFGDEFDTLLPAAERIAAILRDIPGAADVARRAGRPARRC